MSTEIGVNAYRPAENRSEQEVEEEVASIDNPEDSLECQEVLEMGLYVKSGFSH